MKNESTINKTTFVDILKHDKFFVALIAVFVFIICAWHIPQRESIYLTTDEFSQYSIAAFFAGFDWSNVTSYVFYYQFGYPLVFILPLFWVFGDDILMVYRASLVVNSLLAASIVPLVYYLLRHWGLKSFWENKVSILVAAMLALQGCVVAYSNLGISEVLLMVLGLLSTALIVKVLKTGATHKLVMLLAFVLVYGYSTHMRFLGVLLSGVLIFILMVISNKMAKKYLISFFAVLLVSFVLSEVIKYYNQGNIWLFKDAGLLGSSDPNDITITSGLLRTFFTRSGFSGFLQVLFGQMWYMGFASCLLVFVGLLVILRDNMLSIKKLIKEKVCIDYDFTALFLLCGFIATLAISALYFMHAGMGIATRADRIMYGRYNSIMLIPVSLFAISSIINSKQKPYVISIISVIIFSFLTVFLNSYNDRFLSGIWMMHFNVINYIVFESVYLNSFFAINVFLLIVASMLTKYRQLLLSIAVSVMIIFNIHAGYLFLSREVIPHNDIIGFNSLTDFKEYKEIYYYPGEIYFLPRVQMALPNTRIHVVNDFSDFSNDANRGFLASKRHLTGAIIDQRLNLNVTDVMNGIVDVNNITVGDNPITLPLELFSSQNGVFQDNSVVSNGNQGFLIYGPYVTLSTGVYIFSAQLELLNQNGALWYIGYAELSYNNGAVIITHQPLHATDFEDGKLTVFLEVNTDELLPNFEFRIFPTEGTQLKVSNVKVSLPDS